jgi:hypothetical protein
MSFAPGKAVTEEKRYFSNSQAPKSIRNRPGTGVRLVVVALS